MGNVVTRDDFVLLMNRLYQLDIELYLKSYQFLRNKKEIGEGVDLKRGDSNQLLHVYLSYSYYYNITPHSTPGARGVVFAIS